MLFVKCNARARGQQQRGKKIEGFAVYVGASKDFVLRDSHPVG